MSQGTKPVGESAATPRPAAEDARPAPRAGEFDRVLERRRPAAEPGRAGREREPGAERSTRTADAVRGREERRGKGEGSGGEGQHEGGRERSEWRALPGDIAVPLGLPPVRVEAAAGGVRASEMAALVERIAGGIVHAVEVQLGTDGVAQARLVLDLASLGQAGVQVQRGADGAVAVRFDGVTAELGQRLQDGLSDLVARLEARGLEVREIVIRDTEGATVRVEPGREATAEEEARRQAEEDSRRRHQAPPSPPDEDE